MRSYFKDIGLGVVTLARSMWVAWLHLFTRSVTLQYPTEKWTMPERSRGRLLNKIENCMGCGQCARACPTNCITIQTEKRGKDEPPVYASDGTQIKLRTTKFDIDMTKCCYCSLCTFPCPTQSLIMTGAYEYSVYDKKDHLYHFAVDQPKPAEPKETATDKA